ncbi:hypothetical protein ACQY0O_001022 [Thecaphora frezii]
MLHHRLSRLVALVFVLALASLRPSLCASLSARPTPSSQRYLLARAASSSPSQLALRGCLESAAKVWLPSNHAEHPLQLLKLSDSAACAHFASRFDSSPSDLLLESQRDASPKTILLATRDAIEAPYASTAEATWQVRLRRSLVYFPNDPHALVAQKAELELDAGAHIPTGNVERGADILYSAHDFALLEVDAWTLTRIDTLLPWDTRVRRIVFGPALAASAAASQEQLDDANKPEPLYGKPRYNPLIGTILSSDAFDVAKLEHDVGVLTGEAPQPGQGWESRHSSTYGAHRAAEWIRKQLSQSLASVAGSHCELWHYDDAFSPNVVCTIPAHGGRSDAAARTKRKGEGEGEDKEEDEGVVLISAHYDSRGTFGDPVSPGGDDDGSGTTALLAIARALGRFSVSFTSPVQLVAFSGEEQGLIGSQHYASHLVRNHTSVKLALQMDMLAYHAAGEPMQLAFPDRLSTTSATRYVQHLAQIYTPQLVVGFTPACCSDHQSFWQAGFPATWVFERNGPIADPMYHNSQDLSRREGYDLAQLQAAAKAVAATLLDVARFYL